MKLRGKIVALYLVFVLFIIIVIGLVTYNSQLNAVDELTETNLQELASAYSHDIETQFGSFQKIISVIGNDERLYGDYSDKLKAATITTYAEAFGFVSGNILDTHGVSLSDGTDFSDREYVQKALNGEINVSDMTVSKLTGNYGCSIAGPLYNAQKQICGVIYFRMEIGQLQEITSNVHVSENSYAFILNKNLTVICHDDVDLINNMTAADIEGFDKELANVATVGSGVCEYDYNGVETEAAYSTIGNTDGWILVAAAPARDFRGAVRSLLVKFTVIEVIAIILTLISGIGLANYIAKPVNRMKDVLIHLSEGDFSSEISAVKGKDEIAQLTNATVSLKESLTGVFGDSTAILERMAHYDLTADDMKEYPGEFNTMSVSVNQIKTMMYDMIKNVQEAVANVGVGANEIADASNALSEGTVSQASSIQQVVSNIEGVALQTEKNSENGTLVNEKLQHLDELIKTSNVDMAELRSVVLEIEEMSGDIQKIVSDIDSISFQTNILALNASVEAARAGDNGKGFAVVADEVGNLANKSSESSKKTAELIDKCIASIAKAKKCADHTFDSLHEIVENSGEIASAFEEITTATEEQAVNTKNIKLEVTKISDVVQTNTATAQQTAASTQVLSGEAENLGLLVQKFRV